MDLWSFLLGVFATVVVAVVFRIISGGVARSRKSAELESEEWLRQRVGHMVGGRLSTLELWCETLGLRIDQLEVHAGKLEEKVNPPKRRKGDK